MGEGTGSASEREEGCGSGPGLRIGVWRHGGRRTRTRSAAGVEDVHRAGRRPSRPRDRARAISHPRPVVPLVRRPAEMRRGIQRAHQPLRIRRHRAQQPRHCAPPLLRDMPTAIEEMKQAVAILPKSVRQRSNLAVYASYGGDFQTAEQEAQELQKLDPAFPKGFTALAFAHIGQDRLRRGRQRLPDSCRASTPPDAASGLADLALFQGRLTEAVRTSGVRRGCRHRGGAPDRAADKLSLLAYTYSTRGQTRRGGGGRPGAGQQPGDQNSLPCRQNLRSGR